MADHVLAVFCISAIQARTPPLTGGNGQEGGYADPEPKPWTLKSPYGVMGKAALLSFNGKTGDHDGEECGKIY